MPPGHIAAGYLTSYLFLTIFPLPPEAGQAKELLFFGALFGFLPDLDFFYAFFQTKTLRIGEGKNNHRYFFTHTPIFWLAAGLAIYFLFDRLFFQYLGLLLWVCAWGHLFCDSFDCGVRWLWPFSDKFYGFRNPQLAFPPSHGGFFSYWINFVQWYAKNLQTTFVLEVLILILAIYFWLGL